eukprot:125392_1
MALALAKEFTQCSNCDVPLTEESLHTCTIDECPKYGEIYCEDCGQRAHKRQDHSFDPNGSTVKTITVHNTAQSIKKGMGKMKGALGLHKEQKNVAKRQDLVGTYLSIQSMFYAMEALVDVSVELAPGGIMVGAVTDTVIEYAQIAAEGACGAAIAMSTVEVVYHSYRYWTGDIETRKEWAYHVMKGIASSGGMGLGNWSGGGAGIAIGSIGGPLGAFIGGLVGQILGGFLGAKCGRAAFDKVWEDEFGIKKDQAVRAQLMKEALLLFGYVSIDDIEDEKNFTEKEISKRYRKLSKQYHPDKNHGTKESYAKFHTINASLGCLLSILKQKNRKKIVKELKEIQKAIKW